MSNIYGVLSVCKALHVLFHLSLKTIIISSLCMRSLRIKERNSLLGANTWRS